MATAASSMSLEPYHSSSFLLPILALLALKHPHNKFAILPCDEAQFYKEYPLRFLRNAFSSNTHISMPVPKLDFCLLRPHCFNR